MDLETLKEEVRARADIVDIVGRSVKLQRASGSWKGLCPFHQEKTPSFTVNPSRQSYHCFGCDAGGDVFKFIMEMEHLDFMGALERLANQVGVPFELDGSRGDAGVKKRQLELHTKTAQWYRDQLLQAREAEGARQYLASRELAPETPEAFQLGYAPETRGSFIRFARDLGFTDKELEDSGLVGVGDTPREGDSLYDRFRNRLMFPITDEQGRVIGFSGRIVPPAEVRAKYLNSPETLLFKKSRVLYGIDKARKPMAEARRAILCEGQLDVIRCHEAGLTEAVAAQGTAFTEEHARILKRYADEVILLLDADSAGIKAALRSAEILLGSDLAVSVASLPDGEDPDDLVRAQGNKALVEVVKASEPFVVFQVRTLVRQEGDINEASRLRVARQVMQVVAQVPGAVHREDLIRQAAVALGMSEEALKQDLLANQKSRTASRSTTSRFKAAPTPSRPAQTPPPAPTPRTPVQSKGQIPPTERHFLECLLLHADQLPMAQKLIQPHHLLHPESRQLLELFYQVEQPTRDAILDLARDHEHGEKVFAIDPEGRLKWNEELGTPEEGIQELAVLLRKEDLNRQRTLLQEKAKTADDASRHELEAEIWRLRMHEAQLKESTKLRKWDKARILLDMIDLQSS